MTIFWVETKKICFHFRKANRHHFPLAFQANKTSTLACPASLKAPWAFSILISTLDYWNIIFLWASTELMMNDKRRKDDFNAEHIKTRGASSMRATHHLNVWPWMAVIRLTDRTGSWRTRLAAPLSPLCLAFWTLHSRWLAAALEPANKHCEHCQLRFSHDSTRSVSSAAAWQYVFVSVRVVFFGAAAGKFLTRTWQLLYEGQGNDISGTQQHHAQWVRLFSKKNLPRKTLNGFPTVFCEYPWRGIHSNYAVSSGKVKYNKRKIFLRNPLKRNSVYKV